MISSTDFRLTRNIFDTLMRTVMRTKQFHVVPDAGNLRQHALLSASDQQDPQPGSVPLSVHVRKEGALYRARSHNVLSYSKNTANLAGPGTSYKMLADA